jgi:hypothetical protein
MYEFFSRFFCKSHKSQLLKKFMIFSNINQIPLSFQLQVLT